MQKYHITDPDLETDEKESLDALINYLPPNSDVIIDKLTTAVPFEYIITVNNDEEAEAILKSLEKSGYTQLGLYPEE